MSKRDLILVTLIGLLCQAFWATLLVRPSYMDGYYYTTNGQRLAQGDGFTEAVIWQFLDEPTGLPTPSHTYWMPLPSILAAAGYSLGNSFRLAQLPFWLLAGALPLLAYLISHQLSRTRWQAWVAALLTASGGFYVHWLSQPSTFAPFAWFGGAALFTMAKAQAASTHTWRWWGITGLLAGLAHLTRADGVLLLVVALLLIVWPSLNRQRLTTAVPPLLVGYLLVMGGWFVQMWRVTGSPLATVGTQTIFLQDYDDLFAYGRSFDLDYFLSWGWQNIISSRLSGLWVTAQTFVAVSCLIFLTPLVVWAWVKLSRERPFLQAYLRPFTLYALSLWGVMSFIFTLPGERGGLFHSSAALWPWCMALAAAGLSMAVDAIAAKLSHWQPERAKRTFAALFVAVAFIFSFIIGLGGDTNEMEALHYEQIGAQLPTNAVVMVGNAPGFHYHTQLPALSVPNESVPQLLLAAEQYGVTHLILDENRPEPLASLYDTEVLSPEIILIDTIEDVKLYELVRE